MIPSFYNLIISNLFITLHTSVITKFFLSKNGQQQTFVSFKSLFSFLKYSLQVSKSNAFQLNNTIQTIYQLRFILQMKKHSAKGLSFKIILIGDHSTGKTALIQRYIHDAFNEEFNVTVGAEFSSKTLQVEGNYIQLQIWDTSGQDVYHSITRSFYRGAASVFMVYSLDNRKSFQHMQEWLDDFYEKGSKDVFVFVVGTKSDLEKAVSSEEAYDFMKKNEGAFYIETSSKQNQNVKILFQKAAESMYKLYSVSAQYRELVNMQKLSKIKGSVIERSGISIQDMKISRINRKCC